MNKWRPKVFELEMSISQPVPIVDVASVSVEGFSEGRFLPTLVLDTADRPDIDELVKLHDQISAGDVKFQWGSRERGVPFIAPFNLETIFLMLEFTRPIETTFLLEFNIAEQGGLVENILNANVICLQPGREGDKFILNTNRERMFAELHPTGFEQEWPTLWRKALSRKYREMGLARRASNDAAIDAISQLRTILDKRM